MSSSSADELHLHTGYDYQNPVSEQTLISDLQEAEENNDVRKVILFNLEVSIDLANALRRFFRARFAADKQQSPTTLEILGCTGHIDRVLEGFIVDDDNNGATATATGDTDVFDTIVPERELILQHNNPNHFDSSVFVALGKALDSRIPLWGLHDGPRYCSSKSKLLLRLYQPVLSEAMMWALSQGIQNSHHLQELDFGSCRFTPLSVNHVTRHLAEALLRNQHLKSLQLAQCELSDDQVACIARGLEGHPSLEILNLAGNKCRTKGLIALASALSTVRRRPDEASVNPSLPFLKINLSNQHMGRTSQKLIDPSVMQVWHESTGFLDRLGSLDLSANCLDDHDLNIVGSALFHRRLPEEDQHHYVSAIQDLKLSNNKFTDDGMDCLGDAISKYQPCGATSRGWRTLDLTQNKSLSEVALAKLADAIKDNFYLEEILIDGGNVPPATLALDSAVDKIRFYSILNRGGRRALSYSASILPLSLWPFILARINRIGWSEGSAAKINVLYHMISQGSILHNHHR